MIINAVFNEVNQTLLANLEDFTGYEVGKTEGYNDGYSKGFAEGSENAEGYEEGYQNGYDKGREDGGNEAYPIGFKEGKEEGIEQGYREGFRFGREDGIEEGIEQGKQEGKLELLTDSEYMNANVSGTAIAVNDVSPIEHNVGCTVKKLTNMLPYPFSHTTKTVNGITFTDNGDGTITVNGTATSNADFELCGNFEIKKDMVISSGLNGDSGSTYEVMANGLDGTIIHSYSGYERADHDFSVNKIFIRIRPNFVANNLVFKPQLIYAIADGSTVEVSRYGKNLCSNIYTDYADTGYKSLYIANEPLIMSFIDKDTSVDVSGCYFGFTTDPNVAKEYRWIVNNGVVSSSKTNDAVQNGKQCPYLFMHPKTEETFNKLMQRWYIQVELGKASTDYTPYIESTTYTANADGTVEGIKSISPNMTLLTNNNGVVINANYLRDIDTYINNLITDIALSGGE